MAFDAVFDAVFAHCTSVEDRWATFYSLACLCHPSQGGSPGDMEALMGLGRNALPDFPWGPDDAIPPLFDVFCRATGTAADRDTSHTPPGDDVPAPYEPRPPYGPEPRLGRLELAFKS